MDTYVHRYNTDIDMDTDIDTDMDTDTDTDVVFITVIPRYCTHNSVPKR